MGDRGNIAIKQSTPDDQPAEHVWLYSHWGGTELPDVLQRALASPAGQGRLGDEAYLARIVFDLMVGKDQGGETGYGISTRMTDNEHPILVVDCSAGKVELWSEGHRGLGKKLWEWTIADYVALGDAAATVERARRGSGS